MSSKRPAPKAPPASRSRSSVTKQEKPVGNGNVTKSPLAKSNTLPHDWTPGRHTEDLLRKRMERLKKNIEKEAQGRSERSAGSKGAQSTPTDIKSPGTTKPGRTFTNLSVAKYERLLKQKQESSGAKRQTEEVKRGSSLRGSRVPVSATRRASMSPSSTRSTPPSSSRETPSQRTAREHGEFLRSSSKKIRDGDKTDKKSTASPRKKRTHLHLLKKQRQLQWWWRVK